MSKLEIIKSYYEPKLASILPDYAMLGWESEAAQRMRFDALIDNIPLDGQTILDVGCGLANLLEYLNQLKIKVRYTGVDILHEMIESVRAKKLSGEFHCLDVFSSHPFQPSSFDVIYASGIFNLNLGNNKEFFEHAMCEFSRLSRRYVVFNLLDNRSPAPEDTYFYYSPAEAIEMIEHNECRPKKIEIVEQYLNNDFTVICEY